MNVITSWKEKERRGEKKRKEREGEKSTWYIPLPLCTSTTTNKKKKNPPNQMLRMELDPARRRG